MQSDAPVTHSGLQLRPMGIGDILDTTFRMYQRDFATFVLIAMIVYMPYALLAALVTPAPQNTFEAFEQASRMPVDNGNPFATSAVEFDLPGMIISVLLMLLYIVVLWPLCQGAMVHKISAGYLGEPLGAGDAYRRAARRLLPLLGTNILAFFFVSLGFIALIVPGIILSLGFWVVPAVVMLEGVGGMAALKRCWTLSKGNLGKAFLLALTIGVLVAAISFGLTMVIGFLPLGVFLGNFLNVVVQALMLPIQIAAIILFYYDLRIRKEAFDLEQLASELEISPA